MYLHAYHHHQNNALLQIASQLLPRMGAVPVHQRTQAVVDLAVPLATRGPGGAEGVPDYVGINHLLLVGAAHYRDARGAEERLRGCGQLSCLMVAVASPTRSARRDFRLTA